MKIVLEVERKFVGFAVPDLTSRAGQPPFISLVYRGCRTFTDTYFDHKDMLSSNGLWVRKRQFEGHMNKWEAKQCQGGTFTNSKFEELSDVKSIAQRVGQISGLYGKDNQNFGLTPIARLTTTRKLWHADEDFHIVYDKTDFGHTIGEVELEKTIAIPDNLCSPEAIETWKSEVSQDLDKKVQEFMKHYNWAFQVGRPVGKLTAYFERQRTGI